VGRPAESIPVTAQQLASVEDVASLARESTLEAFERVWSTPTLLIYPFSEYSTAHIQTVSASGPRPSVMAVAALRKRPGANAFANMLTIGRARNNDIEVRASDASKFHAYLSTAAPGDAWRLCDAGSSFGTFLNGERLTPREAVAVSYGAELRLGSVLMSLFAPAGLRAFLREGSWQAPS